MPTVIPEYELVEPDELDLGDFDTDLDPVFKVTCAEGTEEVNSPDEACDLLCDLVAEQFWEWFNDPSRSRRFKPRVKVYEVW